jgi:hypothetical protein
MAETGCGSSARKKKGANQSEILLEHGTGHPYFYLNSDPAKNVWLLLDSDTFSLVLVKPS